MAAAKLDRERFENRRERQKRRMEETESAAAVQ